MGRSVKIGQMVDQMYRLREEEKKFKDEAKRIREQIADLQAKLIEAMELEGLKLVRGELATASLKTATYARPVDFEKFARWAVERGRFDMFYKRVNAAPVVEMLEQENLLPPGVETYSEVKLNLRKL